MRIDTHVSGSARQWFPFPVGNVLLRLRVSILLCHAEVHHVYHICQFRAWSTDKEIIWFDVSVYQILLVYCLNSWQLADNQLCISWPLVITYHLLCHHYNGLGWKSSIAVIKKVFQRGSKEVNDEDIVKTLLAEVINIRYPRYKASVAIWITQV